MDIGITLRNMGDEANGPTLLSCAQAAEQAGLESLWVVDHIAIPPDDAQGSNGRYLDPLITLAWLAQATTRIRLATGVLILPYRPALPTVKQIGTLQELCGERLLLGVGIGWMDAEFRALGVPRGQRGAISDGVLGFLHQAFGEGIMEANGQPFLFRPQPLRPPVLVGGRAPHALQRALEYGDGWLPMAREPEAIAADIATYRDLANDKALVWKGSGHVSSDGGAGPSAVGGRRGASVTVMTSLPLDDPERCRDLLAEWQQLDVARLVVAGRYQSVAQFRGVLDGLAELL